MATPSTKPFSDGIASSPLDKGPNIFPRWAHGEDPSAPSRGISTHARFEPCEADVSERWGDAHSDRSRGLVRL